MGERGGQLLETADRQISRLICLVSRVDETVLHLPCPGREKLGDGTVGALASHTADSYLRIAAFLQTTNEPSPARPGSDRVARLLSARSHTPPSHADSGHNDGTHDRGYKAENVGLPGLIDRLSTGREALSLLADLTDDQLDTMPPAGSFRFCDGHRTLEQVVSSLLKHQGHQSTSSTRPSHDGQKPGYEQITGDRVRPVHLKTTLPAGELNTALPAR